MPGVRRGSKLAKKSLLEQSAALDLADAMGCDPRCKRSFLGRCILYIADERNIATNSFSEIFHVSRLYQCNPHVSSRTASLAIIVPTRSPFFNGAIYYRKRLRAYMHMHMCMCMCMHM